MGLFALSFLAKWQPWEGTWIASIALTTAIIKARSSCRFALDIGEDFATLVVEAEEPWRAIEADALVPPEQLAHPRRRGRPANRVAYPHDEVDVTADETFLVHERTAPLRRRSAPAPARPTALTPPK